MFFLALVMSFLVSAEVEITQTEALSITGLTEKVLVQKTEKSLESYLYYNDDGVSCGLDEFYITHITTSAPTPTMTTFTVVTNVVGPTNSCGGYDEYACYTLWTKKSGAWEVLGSDCEDSTVFAD